jgi:repressor LexA
MLELFENIKKYRKLNHMTQDELAKKTGYTDRSSIAKIERGDVDLPQSKIFLFAQALGISASTLMGNTGIVTSETTAVRIPVYGRVAAGYNYDAIENILGYEEIPASWSGEYAALRVKGSSMEPRIMDGDTLIVKIQDDAESGDVVVAIVNGNESTVKKLIKQPDGIVLQPFNPAYEPMYFSKESAETTPVRIWGKVIQNRQNY